MATCRRFLNLAKKKRTFLYRSQKCYSTVEVKADSSKSDEIIVPYRIHRGPTDILKALASTVSKDYTAPKYKYEDDPYFIPASNVSKRAFALSKESGRKAARYFLEKYPEFFLVNTSVPHIKQFDPPPVYTTENVTSPDVLVECIKDFKVKDSLTVYNILKEKGIVVSQEVKQDLLELLCFYNGSEPPEEDYYEERYFKRSDIRGERWNAKGEAERLFDEMEKDSKAYSAILAGAAKFQDAERALQLFNEMQSKNIAPTVEAYNSLISQIPFMKERRDAGSEYALFLLSNMKKDGLVPNLYTMNAVLDVFVKRRFRKTNELTLGILAEMKRLNIEPSLGTFCHVLNVFCDENNGNAGTLYEVINYIEGKELTARHPLDVSFFTLAMEKCYRLAHDKDLAYRINKIVEYQDNCKLLGNALTESIYFKNFLRLLCETEDFEKFMEIYDRYVPNTYTPEPALMFDVLEALQFTGHYKYLPKVCTDVHVFEQSEREQILNTIMETASCMKHEKKLQEELVEAIWKIVTQINKRLERGRFNFYWTGQLLGQALTVFVNGKDLEKSWSVIEQLAKNTASIVGPPSKESLLNFCDLCLQNREYEKAKFCIKYACKEAFPEFITDFKVLSENMFQTEVLDAKQRVHVDNILEGISFGSSSALLDSSSSSKVDSGNSLEDSSSSSDSESNDSSSGDSSSSDSSSSDEEDNK